MKVPCMEVEEIQTQQQQPPCKLSGVGNDRNDPTKLGHHHYPGHPQDGEEENGCQLIKRPDYPITLAGGGDEGIDINNNSITNINRLCGWHHSSRIIRVSRASGGKDRHSKVWTSKGLRDRRVRLSAHTAIQFYELKDRLGYDQPSKAVEWLIKEAADALAKIPSLDSSFPPDDTSPNYHHQLGDDQKRREHLEDAQQISLVRKYPMWTDEAKVKSKRRKFNYARKWWGFGFEGVGIDNTTTMFCLILISIS